MVDNEAEATGTDLEHVERPTKRGWRERQSVRSLRREAVAAAGEWADFDLRSNEESRLPPGEQVHLGGLALAEAFTPSTISSLYEALAELVGHRGRTDEFLAELTKGRSAAGAGGWRSLGVIRRPGAFGSDIADPELPEAVEAVWPYLYFATPSLTVLVATFTLTDEAGDLSDYLRADYQSESADIHLLVPGRFGRTRAHVPWARPSRHSMRWTQRRAEEQKKRACDSLISRHEMACWNWLAAKFPGRFSAEPIGDRPTVRILLTTENVPFKDRLRCLAPVGLAFVPMVWRSLNPPGWAFAPRSWPRDHRYMVISAARRRDAAQSPGPGISGDTIWDLTQQFAKRQSTLVARWAMTCLLSLYADRLASLRDQAGRRRRVARPVREARDFNRYLIGDGLDASTIVSDLENLTGNLGRFAMDAPEYAEDLSDYPKSAQAAHEPLDLARSLRDSLKEQGGRLQRDMTAATTNITASAQLRQAIANTTVQRRLEVLTLVAIAISIISLVVAVQAHGH